MKTARAVSPNAGVAAWYRGELQDVVENMARDLRPRLRDAWRTPLAYDAKPTLGAGFAAFHRKNMRLQRVIATSAEKWKLKLEGLSLDLSVKFADKARTVTDTMVAKSFKDAGLTVKFKPTKGMRAMSKALVAENVALIRSIPVEFHAQVAKAVRTAVMKGGDLATLAATLQDRYGVTHRRAAFIARDQNAKAKAMFEEQRRGELGITEAILQHSSAGEVPRPTHVAMNGKRYKIAEGFYDSAIGHNTWPGFEPNCRCTSRAVIEGFE